MVAYETLADPLADAERAALWVHTEGGVIHRCCGTVEQCEDLGRRHVDARVANDFSLAECCQNHPGAMCSFDMFSDTDDIDAVVTIAYALARAEGRDIDPPYRCTVHGALTFGGCCD